MNCINNINKIIQKGIVKVEQSIPTLSVLTISVSAFISNTKLKLPLTNANIVECLKSVHKTMKNWKNMQSDAKTRTRGN